MKIPDAPALIKICERKGKPWADPWVMQGYAAYGKTDYHCIVVVFVLWFTVVNNNQLVVLKASFDCCAGCGVENCGLQPMPFRYAYHIVPRCAVSFVCPGEHRELFLGHCNAKGCQNHLQGGWSAPVGSLLTVVGMFHTVEPGYVEV
jgi:hypothetical protein